MQTGATNGSSFEPISDYETVSLYDDYGHIVIHTIALIVLIPSFLGNAYITAFAIYKKNFQLLVFRFPFYVSCFSFLYSLVHIIDHAHLLLHDELRPRWRPRNENVSFPGANSTATVVWDNTNIQLLNKFMNSQENRWIISSPDFIVEPPPEDTACSAFSGLVVFLLAMETLLVFCAAGVTCLRVVYRVQWQLGWMDWKVVVTIISGATIITTIVGSLGFLGRGEFFCIINTFNVRGLLAFVVIIGGTMTVLFCAALACNYLVIRVMRNVRKSDILKQSSVDAHEERVRSLEQAENKIITYLAIHLFRLTGPFFMTGYYLYEYVNIKKLSSSESNVNNLPSRIPTWVYAITVFTYNVGLLNAVVYYRQVKYFNERSSSLAGSSGGGSSSDIRSRASSSASKQTAASAVGSLRPGLFKSGLLGAPKPPE